MAIADASVLAGMGLRVNPDISISVKSDSSEEAVRVAGNSIVFSPKDMELNKFYLVQLDDSPYVYRRTSADEVEVYGLAD